ncbi:flagellar biosynthetic protein FliO [Patulibacter sp. SYSU D01012]|uniref:FliO/MopB family protein n=1 Tax=Patulibacter sp. SYSU D01012 TaxID=2817381 RepID=UPI001B30156F|nr:flagellar biosynthetic protein FliO [Patulibacter sp. SYSU D01012]
MSSRTPHLLSAVTASRSRVARTALLAAASAAVVLACPTAALAQAAKTATTGEDTPLNLGGGDGAAPASSGGSASIARVIAGLLIVVAVIYGVTWLLRQTRRAKDAPSGAGLQAVSSMPLASGSALHLVRVADEVLLVGSGQNGVTALRRYEEDEARELGLWVDPPAPAEGDDGDGGSGPGAAVAARLRGTLGPKAADRLSGLGDRLRGLVARIRSWTVRG